MRGLWIAAALIVGLMLVAGRAQGQGETATPTETPTLTETPTGTPPATEAGTAAPTGTPVPNVRYVATLTSGQAVGIDFTVSAGEALIATEVLILIGLVTFGLYLALRRER